MADELTNPFPSAVRDAFPPTPTEAWLERVAADLRGAPPDRLTWQMPEGIALRPFYRAEDLDALSVPTLARPPEARTWKLRQDIQAAEAEAANRLARRALDGAADLVGFRLGETDGWPPSSLPHLMAGLPAERLVLECEVDRVASLRAEAGAARLTTDALAAPDADAALRPLAEDEAWLLADAAAIHDAGGTAVDELAVALGAVSEYLARLRTFGIDPGAAAARLRIRLGAGPRYFVEIAKLRALRALLPHVLDAYDAGTPELPVEVVTSRWTMTAYDPHTNLLRATTAAAAALVGGCRELIVRPHDAATGLPSDDALRLARNLARILQHEAHLDAVEDPAAGSYYAEILTDSLARTAWTHFQEMESAGGLVAHRHSGALGARLAEARERQHEALNTRRRTLIGTTNYPDSEESRLGALAGADGPPRAATPFEQVRLRTERHAQAHGAPPTVLLYLFGDPVMANARATFALNFLGCGGFHVLQHDPAGDASNLADALAETRPDAVVLCSADAEYAGALAAFRGHAADAAGSPLLLVAGNPDDIPGDLGGEVLFIHRRSPLIETLTALQQRLGITPDDDHPPLAR
ncbi:MAG: methylmalonyl-CoA mutase family protein [Rhodothermales bacterium]|nr:methylmalonyl-CoA mutase family protein [Rhodothermales bacterium]